MPIIIKTPQEIKILEKGGKILAKILKKVGQAVKPGISTLELDELAERLVKEKGGRPSFKGYNGYPATICASVNEEVVHSIPLKNKILRPGDIISLDIGMEYQGLFTDISLTVGVGRISPEAKRLIEITRKSLDIGIKEIAPGKHIGDIGFAIQNFVEKNGFSVVRELTGHGVGKAVHEDPLVPNYGKPGKGEELKPGLVLALEPMVIIGDWRVVTLEDGWTVATADGSLAAHFEQTVMVSEKGYKILTPFYF